MLIPSIILQARGKEALRGPAYHQRLLPAHTQLKFRQPGQGGSADEGSVRDLRAELLAAEAAHFAKKNGGALPPAPSDSEAAADATANNSAKRPLGQLTAHADGDGEDPEAKRRRILEESRDIDADSEDGSDGDGGSGEEDSEEDDDDDDDDDEDAELERELEKIRRERAEKRAKEEAEKAAKEQEERERDIAYGNPLLNPQQQNFNMKRRYVIMSHSSTFSLLGLLVRKTNLTDTMLTIG